MASAGAMVVRPIKYGALTGLAFAS
jgi:hypothetical protein